MESGSPYSTRLYDTTKGEMQMYPDPHRQPVTTFTENTRPITSQAAPRDHLVWSIFNIVHFNFCCLGFFALIYSVKARDHKNVGDMRAATSYGSTAKMLNIATLLLSLLSVILFIVLIGTGVIQIQEANKEPTWTITPGN